MLIDGFENDSHRPRRLLERSSIEVVSRRAWESPDRARWEHAIRAQVCFTVYPTRAALLTSRLAVPHDHLRWQCRPWQLLIGSNFLMAATAARGSSA
ncbi:hypothetical protein [Streptomyces sp. NPDC048269]|uniref:hypothetical protein n=1 Tax=Streptomyces sp. NPDC048269 TaxID=3155753 RepID=UPI0034307BD2